MRFYTNEKQGYDVLDVSRYIINYCIDKDQPITNGKLQKLLFYVQASFLVELGQPCFNEDIISWKLGAVVKESFDEYILSSLNPIKEKQKVIQKISYDNRNGKIIFEKIIFNQNEIFKKSDMEQINKVLDSYIKVSVYDLINKNHSEEPWINSKRNEVISTEVIRSYYRKHPEKIYTFK